MKHKTCVRTNDQGEREGRNRGYDLKCSSRRFLYSETVFGLGTAVFAHDEGAYLLFSRVTNGCETGNFFSSPPCFTSIYNPLGYDRLECLYLQ